MNHNQGAWRVPFFVAAVGGAAAAAIAALGAGPMRPPGTPPEGAPALERRVAADAGSADAPVLLSIGIHVEPFGATVSALAGGQAAAQAPPPRPPVPPFPDRPRPDYNDRVFFRRTVEDLGILARMAERHGAKLSIQVQTPFTRTAAEEKEAVLADLESRGHEVALHFHEDAHLGRPCERLPVETWTAVMREEIEWIRRAGARRIRYWSGGNLYPGLLDAAAAAGLQVMSDYKNPRSQRSDERLQGASPWRPAGGPSETDLAAFARHDPRGKIIYLPVGIYPTVDFTGLKRTPRQSVRAGDAQYFDAMTDGLERTLRAAGHGRVNVFHITVHPGEFRGSPREPYAVIERWLTEVVDPLAKAGKVRWATFSEAADAFAKWEQAHPGVDPRAGENAGQAAPAQAQPKAADGPRACMTFAINVHDTGHVAESAETVLRAVGIFTKHGVRGDFYLTAPIAACYVAERPDVIARLKETRQTISYHVRPPHPAHPGFDARFRDLDDASLLAAARDAETYWTDLGTGALDRSRPGGYALVARAFGVSPVSIGLPAADPRIRRAALQVYRELGARMVVEYHESGTDPDRPFALREGLLVRPSDFSITRWSLPGDPVESFWWNRLDSPEAGRFNPTERLRSEMARWAGRRPPFVTALIHENDFSRRGPVSWSAAYFEGEKPAVPRRPPFRLGSADPSLQRTEAERERIWRAYEDLVAFAAANLKVVTSADIVAMAGMHKEDSR